MTGLELFSIIEKYCLKNNITDFGKDPYTLMSLSVNTSIHLIDGSVISYDSVTRKYHGIQGHLAAAGDIHSVKISEIVRLNTLTELLK